MNLKRYVVGARKLFQQNTLVPCVAASDANQESMEVGVRIHKAKEAQLVLLPCTLTAPDHDPL